MQKANVLHMKTDFNFCTIKYLSVLSFVLSSCLNEGNDQKSKIQEYGVSYNEVRRQIGLYELPAGYKPGFFDNNCLTFTAVSVPDSGVVLTQKLVFIENNKWVGEEDHIAQYQNGKQTFMIVGVDSLNNGIHGTKYYLIGDDGRRQEQTNGLARKMYRQVVATSKN